MRVFHSLLLLLLLSFLASSKQMKLLRNVETEFNKMVESFSSGDTSHAFSIAMKVYFAVKALHTDL